MALQAWVWTADGDPTVEPAAGPGPGWQQIGEIDSNAAPEVFRAVQQRLGIYQSTPPKSLKGYLSGDSRREWVQRLDEVPDEFYLAFGPLGATGGYLTTNMPVRRAIPRSRRPEPHPGAIVPPTFIGIELRAGEDGHFDRH